jgi:hypothetical protein
MSTERGILYSEPMILAKLSWMKTQTRRLRDLDIINGPGNGLTVDDMYLIGDSRTLDLPRRAIKYDDHLWFWWGLKHRRHNDPTYAVRCPWKVGDIFYARETWCERHFKDTGSHQETWSYDYKAGNECLTTKWRPSIHMPKVAARIWERITEIRVERLQDITEADALAEGVVWSNAYQSFHVPGINHPNKEFPWLSRTTARDMYASLWDVINGSGEWLGNPWVWAITTETLSTTGRPKDL